MFTTKYPTILNLIIPTIKLLEKATRRLAIAIVQKTVPTRRLCCSTIRSLFSNEGKHGGELTVQAVYMSIRFDEDIGKRDREDANERKETKREMLSKIRDEVTADYKGATYEPDAIERRKMQTETLSAVFETFFHILSAEEDTTLNPGGLDGLANN
ncbi:hypothetical protein Rs2_34822 [Raphanus sativus]|nr:hypothetical protein Rs2_34822 [Raphanus sativus]